MITTLMNYTDLNTAGGIGANSHYLEIGPFRLLVDAGMHPKFTGRQALPDFKQIPDNTIDFILVSHCHLDHLGALPVVARRHPNAGILMSQPSRMLANRLLHNSVNVMFRQREQLGLMELPLYTHGEVERLKKRTYPMIYTQPRVLEAHNGETIEVTYFPAGHVAGAAGIQLVYKHRKIFITGDVLFDNLRTLSAARFPNREFDTVIMETTRGITERTAEKSREEETDRFLNTVHHTLQHGGSVLIPVFALGRMQEVLTLLNDYRRQESLPSHTLYCGGLGLEIADIFDDISRKTGLLNFRKRILKDLKLKPLPDDLEPGKSPPKPSIFVVSSGMLVPFTPSYRVAASLLHNHRNTICFVGYCDPETPGGKLLATPPGDSFLFEELEYSCNVSAHIERFDMSGHADREQLTDFALRTNPRSLILTHGDPEAREWFIDNLYDLGMTAQIYNPEPLRTYAV